ncbi:MAG: hypothetical protein HUJ65_07370, partial [Oscillospiraceae bacterium]|nr:hypothetical protein [Oscillospiraceae bacterium]
MIKVVERNGRLYMEMCFGGVESHVEVNERTANYLLHTLHEAAAAI